MILDLYEVTLGLAFDVDLDPVTREYVLRRVANEGVTFLTVTLPKFSKYVIASIEHGSYLPHDMLPEFKWKSRSPKYFSGYLSVIFDHDGKVLDDPCPVALRNLRQFCEYFYKLSLEFSAQQLEKAEASFISNDDSLVMQETDYHWVDTCRKNLETYYPSLRVKPHEVLATFRPRFTSGTFSVDSKISKPYYAYKQLPEVSNAVTKSFQAYAGYFKPYPGSPVHIEVTEDTSRDSEVLFVPKDSRGPRVICREPLHQLRGQMSFFDFMVWALEKDSRRRINFHSQEINQSLVKTASVDKKFSTIDLKDASDRIDKNIVNQLFRNLPALRYFTSRRSKYVVLPSGRRKYLNKLAGMGSGLTFPTMALMIHLSICSEITRRTGRDYRSVMGDVYVYGDDIIVPTKYFDAALVALSKFKLHVNKSKSFKNSLFRESCGKDYLNGVEVGPVRMRMANAKPYVVHEIARVGKADLFVSLNLAFESEANAVYQLERHCRELVRAGLTGLASHYYLLLELAIGKLPTVSGDSPILGRYSLKEVIPTGADSSGNYPMVEVVVAVSNFGVFSGLCPYAYLASKLVSDSGLTAADYYDGLQKGSPYGELMVPRRISLRTVRRSCLALHVSNHAEV